MESVSILGVEIDVAGGKEMVERIGAAARRGRARVAYVNAHTLNLAYEQPALREALGGSDFVLNDGVGVSLAARLQRRRFPENLNGSDFTPRLLDLCAREGWPVFLLGGQPGVAQRAADELSRTVPSLRIVGARDGFQRKSDLDVEAVRVAGAEVLLVAMGNPLQELWLQQHFERLPRLRLGVGVGAFLDFQSKTVSRAPRWMNRWGIEWVYRLTREPKRLAKRYLLGNPRFLWRVARERARLMLLAPLRRRSLPADGVSSVSRTERLTSGGTP
jgi:exopolysaccharide biosynthesis WecB/TagA/CpsF family protein